MKFIKRFWILEITLFLVAILGIGVAVTNLVSANGQQPVFTNDSASAFVVAESEQPVVERDDGMDGKLNQDESVGFDELEDEEGFDSANDDEEAEFDDEAFGEEEADEEAFDEVGEGEGEEDFDEYEVIANAIGIDVETLEQGLFGGKSMADIAAEHGVDSQVVINALIEQEIAFVDSLQRSDEIDRDEADEWRNEIPLYVPFRVNTPYVEAEVVASQVIGIDVETMWEMLEAGQTMRAIAEMNGVDAQLVIDAVIASETAYIDKMTEAGLVEPDEAEEWKAEIREIVQRMVNETEDMWEVEEEEEEDEE